MDSNVPVLYENTVRFEETDLQGIVFYGNYLTYLDETVTAYFRELGYGDSQWTEGTWSMHVVHVSVNYRAPASFGDVLQHAMRVSTFGNSSLQSEYTARHRDEDRTVVDGEIVHVFIDAESGETIPVPDDFRRAVRDYQARPPESDFSPPES